MDFTTFKDRESLSFEAYLEGLLSHLGKTALREAMAYSFYAPGKRIRPLLLLACLASFGFNPQLGYPAAGAVELIHTYSLIHDDLPAMDDDDLRRGQASNHKKYGEGLAILAGDALLTLAFELILSTPVSDPTKIKLTQLLSQTAGPSGMVLGQALDLAGEGEDLSLDQVSDIHAKKTGQLLRFTLEGAGLIAQKDPDTCQLLGELGLEVGLAYQVRDDILDLTASSSDLGKPRGSDQDLSKSTYPSLLGIQGAKDQLAQSLHSCLELLKEIEKASHFDKSILESFILSLNLEGDWDG